MPRGSTYAADRVSKAERLELIRRLIVSGIPDWQIRRQLVLNGVPMGDGRTCQISRATLCKDLAEIGQAYRELHDSTEVQERVIGAIFERLSRIALAAEAAHHWTAAIRANMAIAELVSRRSRRWQRGEQATGATAGASSTRYEGMTDAELQRELAAKRERAARLGLTLVAGGGSAGGSVGEE